MLNTINKEFSLFIFIIQFKKKKKKTTIFKLILLNLNNYFKN